MREALIVWNGWEGHDPEKCAQIYRRWLHDDGFSVRIEDDIKVLGDPDIHKLALIVPIITMGKIEKSEVANLADAVENGVGLAGHHSMTGAFRDSAEYHFIVGGQFVSHPGNIIDFRVNVTKPDDPVMQGITDFDYRSEQYYMHVDPANEVLATTTFSGEHAYWTRGVVMPVAWKRHHGRGRVFYSALGHSVDEFDVPEMATIIRRGIRWASRADDK